MVCMGPTKSAGIKIVMNMTVGVIQENNSIIKEDLWRIVTTDFPWESLRGKTILVTGGGGFLAAYLVKSLLAAGRMYRLGLKVVCLARSMQGINSRLSEYKGGNDFSMIQHDVSLPVPAELPRADIVIHSASQASPKYYGVDPIGTLLANSAGTMHLLDFSVRSQAEHFMFFSSGEVYGIPVHPDQLVSEKDYGYIDPMNVRSCYAESKRMGETMCVAWTAQHGLHTTVVRPFHTYGPGMALDDGRVFADFVANVVNKRDIVLRSDGSALRPFCYIADATIAFLTVLFKGQKAKAYNIGNPDAEVSIKELAATIVELFPERGVGVKFLSPKAGDSYLNSPILRSCPAIENIKALGWFPVTGIQAGFRRTIQSFL